MTLVEQAAPVESSQIRDLDAEMFTHLYGCDRYTATVLSNRFD